MSKKRIWYSISFSYLLVVLCRFLVDPEHFQSVFGWVSLGLVGLFVVGSGIALRGVNELIDAVDALKGLAWFVPFSLLILVVMVLGQSPVSGEMIMNWFVVYFATPIYVGLVLKCLRTSPSEHGAADSKMRA